MDRCALEIGPGDICAWPDWEIHNSTRNTGAR
jgi:hypothetical protein